MAELHVHVLVHIHIFMQLRCSLVGRHNCVVVKFNGAALADLLPLLSHDVFNVYIGSVFRKPVFFRVLLKRGKRSKHASQGLCQSAGKKKKLPWRKELKVSKTGFFD